MSSTTAFIRMIRKKSCLPESHASLTKEEKELLIDGLRGVNMQSTGLLSLLPR